MTKATQALVPCGFQDLAEALDYKNCHFSAHVKGKPNTFDSLSYTKGMVSLVVSDSKLNEYGNR